MLSSFWILRRSENMPASSPPFSSLYIPEGITIIGDDSFRYCNSLKEIKFPKSLTSIGEESFCDCSSLEEVDLLHTNVLELGKFAFDGCTSLREMKVPDSLQDLGTDVFWKCSKLVDINVNGVPAVTSEVVAYLRSKPVDI